MDPPTFVGAVVLALFAIAYLLLWAVVGEGQERHRVPADAGLLLARSCVSERSWALETADCRAIAEVVRVRMLRTGETFVEAIGELAPRLHGEEPMVRRPWLQFLERDGRRPTGWPRARWERPGSCGEDRTGRCRVARREDWEATLREADLLVALIELRPERPIVCSEPPSAWGSVQDVRLRAVALGRRWHSVDCGETRNLFGWWEVRR